MSLKLSFKMNKVVTATNEIWETVPRVCSSFSKTSVELMTFPLRLTCQKSNADKRKNSSFTPSSASVE